MVEERLFRGLSLFDFPWPLVLLDRRIVVGFNTFTAIRGDRFLTTVGFDSSPSMKLVTLGAVVVVASVDIPSMAVIGFLLSRSGNVYNFAISSFLNICLFGVTALRSSTFESRAYNSGCLDCRIF
jgi:hypothetical protein